MFTAHINKNNEMQSCKEHCAQTAFLCRRCMSDTGFENISYLAGILHDCGKFTNEFNDYIMSASKSERLRKGEVIHSFAGVSLVLNEYHRKHSDNEYELLTAEIIAAAVGSHHGLFDCVDDM
ncbi:MAG: CRISPR-associated endonuclease Cas3'' [Clostridiales bacterium]|nr:CRISPR-associated endonuclease Cas3'' [Clostridiales bacterium]